MEYRRALRLVAFVFVALALSAILMSLFGVPFQNGIALLFYFGFSPNQSLVSTLNIATPLIFMSLGLLIPYIAGFWNIGGQGQFVLGSIFATWFGLTFAATLPPAVLIPLAFVFAFLGGALWAMPPVLMKIGLGVNEVITTIMMNFIAVFFLDYLLVGPMEGAIPRQFHAPASDALPAADRIPVLFQGTTVTWALIGGVVLAIGLFLFLKYSRFGYELRIVGASQEVAKYAGIQIRRDVLFSMVISGGLAGMAGMVEIYATSYVLLPQVFSDITTSFGYVGIPVALIAFLNPIGTIFSSVFFAGMLAGAYGLEQSYSLPIDLVTTTYGLLMFAAVLGLYGKFGESWRFWRRRK